MPVELSVEGADRLRAVADAMRRYGRGDLKAELTKGLSQATKPLRAAAKKKGTRRLPNRGGLDDVVAKTRLATRVRTGRDPSVRISAATNAVRDPLRIDRGRIKHPTYGHGPWVLQDVKPGWFTEPMEQGAPEVREQVIQVLDGVAKKIRLISK